MRNSEQIERLLRGLDDHLEVAFIEKWVGIITRPNLSTLLCKKVLKSTPEIFNFLLNHALCHEIELKNFYWQLRDKWSFDDAHTKVVRKLFFFLTHNKGKDSLQFFTQTLFTHRFFGIYSIVVLTDVRHKFSKILFVKISYEERPINLSGVDRAQWKNQSPFVSLNICSMETL